MDKEDFKQAAQKIKLLALDLDGTVFNEKRECTPETARAIQDLADKGYIVIISTGRPYQGIVGGSLPVTGIRYVISSDGARLTECSTDKCLWSRLIPYEIAADLVDDVLEVGNRVYFQNDYTGEPYVAASPAPDSVSMPGLDREHDREPGIFSGGLGDIIRSGKQDISKIGLWFSRPDGYEYYEKFVSGKYPGLNIFLAETTELEFTDRKADKGGALRALKEILSLGPGEVCAVGDGGNDIPMFEEADLAVSMGNGSDSAKEAADLIIGYNTENGLAVFLDEYFL